MKGRLAITGLALVLAATLILPGATIAARPTSTTGAGDDEVFAYFNFEKDLGPWSSMTDDSYYVASMVRQAGDNGCPDLLGWHYAQLATIPKPLPPNLLDTDAPRETGTWTVADFLVPARQGHMLVTLRWSARLSAEITGNLKGAAAEAEDGPYAMAYAGTEAPIGIDQFKAVITKGGLTHEWQSFSYWVDVDLGESSNRSILETPVYAGIGWNGVGDSMDLDCVSVTIARWPSDN